MLGDYLRRPPRRLPARATVSLDVRSSPAEQLERALEVRAFLGFRLYNGRKVRVRMVADLVTGGEDRLDRAWIPLGDDAGDEEGRGQRVFAQQVEEPRHAHVRAVGLVRHHAGVARVLAALRQDRGFRVEVERETGVDLHDFISARNESSS